MKYISKENLIEIACEIHGVTGSNARKLFENMSRNQLIKIIKAEEKLFKSKETKNNEINELEK